MRRSKYGAKPTVVDGWRFDSKKEARRYAELLLLGQAGEIWNLELQPAFALRVDGIQVGVYRADFAYEARVTRPPFNDGGVYLERVVEDVKGFDVPLGRWKRKHVKAQYGIDVVLVR